MSSRPLIFPLLALLACSDRSGVDSWLDSASDSEPPATPFDAESTWTGTVTYTSSMDVELGLIDDGGDLLGQVTISTGDGDRYFYVTGTYDPGSGQLALAPHEWNGPSGYINLMGFNGRFDPETNTLRGAVTDSSTPNDGGLDGGPFELSLSSGAWTPTAAGAGAQALDAGSSSFSGTIYCSSEERLARGELEYDGAGGVTGQITFTDSDFSDNHGTFAVSGVHNPTTGGITLAPGLYVERGTSGQDFLNFWLDGRFDAGQRRFVGDVRNNVGGCAADGASFSFE